MARSAAPGARLTEPEADLSDLLPRTPFEELVMRSALGLPGQPPIEVGLRVPRFGESTGRPWSNRQMALRRALGGVLYPVTRAELIAQTERWLRVYPQVYAELESLPDAVYGGELEVLLALADDVAAHDGHSTGPGKDADGSEKV